MSQWGKDIVGVGTETEMQNAERGEQDRYKLQTGETFAKKNCAEENVHQRRHEITEAGLDDATNIDRVDEEKPIRRDGQTAGETINSRTTRTHIGEQFRPAPLPAQHD